MEEKYHPSSITVGTLLSNIEEGIIAVPEIQRPFVWKRIQVRDLIDSLYKGYPTGYVILWQNPNVKLKDGTMSAGKKILIDGQQRITALMTAILGIPVINSEYKKVPIKIAFDPFAALSDDPDAEIFAVQDQSHLRSKRWIADIADVFRKDFNQYEFLGQYCQDNPEMTPTKLNGIIMNLIGITNCSIGTIELSSKLNIDVVTDIFIRINSKGTALSQGDFVMSKIAADETNGGNTLRKAIDYFSHLSVDPAFYMTIENEDKEFAGTEYYQKIRWLRDETEDVYDPDYDDVLRIAFMHKVFSNSSYPRGKLSDLVSLLSGRNFETQDYEAEIITETYKTLKEGVLDVFNEYYFKNFMVAIHGAGFISSKMVNSQMALDFVYTLYLLMVKDDAISAGEKKRIVQKWYVLSVLTGRYSGGSPESAFTRDLRLIFENGIVSTLRDMEAATLSETFWSVAVPQNLAYTSVKNPTYLVYLAAQVMMKDVSLLSNNIYVSDLITTVGDVHHIFPKAYLKDKGYQKGLYNQVANYTFLDTAVNKDISMKAPCKYFSEAIEQCSTGVMKCGTIMDEKQLMENLKENCVPEGVFNMDESDYEDFLTQRRELMAKKIKKYYESL